MTDVFVSYASEDRERVRKLASALGTRGWSVWWDRKIIAGQSFDHVIEHELETAKSVVVLWSQVSISSEWVKNEAAVASERGVLVPALIDRVKPPLEFRRKQTADLVGWDGDPSHGGFQALCDGVAARANILGVAPHQPTMRPVLRSRWNLRWTFGAIASENYLTRRQTVMVAIASAAITAFFSNFNEIAPFLKDAFSSRGTVPLTGSWTGTYRDLGVNFADGRLMSENIELHQRRGTDIIVGTAQTSESIRRKWDLKGTIYRSWQDDAVGPFIVLSYRSADDRASIGSYVIEQQLEGPKNYIEYKGYWLGYDPDLKKIIACPYVLSRDPSTDEVMTRFKNWLSQACSFGGTTPNSAVERDARKSGARPSP